MRTSKGVVRNTQEASAMKSVRRTESKGMESPSPQDNGEAGQGISGNAERINGAEGIKARGVASKAKAKVYESAHCTAEQRQSGASRAQARPDEHAQHGNGKAQQHDAGGAMVAQRPLGEQRNGMERRISFAEAQKAKRSHGKESTNAQRHGEVHEAEQWRSEASRDY